MNKNDIMTYIDKKSYLSIINYFTSNIKEVPEEYINEIKESAKCFTKSSFSKKLRLPDKSQKNKSEKERKNYIFDFFDFKEKEALKIQTDVPLVFNNRNGYIKIDISDKEINNKNDEYFISNLKKVMSLEESDEKIKELIGDYKITEDNYKKMILILFRIFTNIPVILMGETGCGKTGLIKQLMKMLNKDKDDNNEYKNFIIKNMHSRVK